MAGTKNRIIKLSGKDSYSGKVEGTKVALKDGETREVPEGVAIYLLRVFPNWFTNVTEYVEPKAERETTKAQEKMQSTKRDKQYSSKRTKAR